MNIKLEKTNHKRTIALILSLVMICGVILPTIPATHAETVHPDQRILTSSSSWKYLDNNSDPYEQTEFYKALYGGQWGAYLNNYRTYWNMPLAPYEGAGLIPGVELGMNDNSWRTGPGPFGYKNGSTPSAWGALGTSLTGNIQGTTDRVKTYFFRHNFTLSEATDWVKSATYKLRYDDAVIIYLNGEKIGQHNLPEKGYSQNVEYGAATAPGDFQEATGGMNIKQGLLRQGSNTIAVEVHQDRADSSDIFLDFMDFTLSENKVILSPEITNLNMQPGKTEKERNFTWLSSVAGNGKLTIWKESGSVPKNFTAVAADLSDREDFYTNKVTVTGLEPNTSYCYKVSNEEGNDRSVDSDIYTFKTGKSASTFSFLLAGDPQIGSSGNAGTDASNWQNTIRSSLMAWSNIDFIVSAGDQVESAGSEEHYDGFFSPKELPSIPVASTVGNHDNSSNYLGHFNPVNMSKDKGTTAAGGDYAYTYGETLFMMINSNNTSTAEHRAFLQDSIAAYKSSHSGSAPAWKIVVFHHGLYSSASHTTDTDIRQRRAELSPILSQLDIDAVLAGHDHVYTRSYMMSGSIIEGVETGAGTTPIKSGYIARGKNEFAEYTKKKAGETIYIESNSASGSKFYPLTRPDYPFIAKQDQANKATITKIDVTDSSMTFSTYYANEATISTSAAIDTFTLRRPVVSSVSVSPRNASIVKGKSYRFAASVKGVNSPAKTVKWSVTGNKSRSTRISQTGVLTIAANEKAARLTVKAVSTANSRKYGSVSVKVTPPKTPAISRSAVPASKKVSKGSTITLKAPRGTVLYYTINGRTPTRASKIVRAGRNVKIKITKRTIVKVIAVRTGYTASSIVTRSYSIR